MENTKGFLFLVDRVRKYHGLKWKDNSVNEGLLDVAPKVFF